MRLKDLVVIMLCFLITSSFFVIFFNEQCRASGNEIYVDSSYHGVSDGSAEKPYESIQNAIDIANEGDIIYVFGGTYEETLVINKKIKLIGSIEGGDTIIDGRSDNRYTVEITADYVTLEDVTISDSEDYITSPIGALLAVRSSNVVVQGNNITDTQTWGIYMDSSSDGSVVSGNIINDTKKGIYVFSSATNDIFNNVISNCSEHAIQLRSSPSNRLYSNYINNSSHGIYVEECSNINVSYNIVTSSVFYGIYLSQSDHGVINNNNIFDNEGDGIYSDSFNCEIISNFLDNNRRGITLGKSDCSVIANYMNSSTASGIYTLSGSINNIIYLNHFLNNGKSAQENGDNLWYHETQGNYWSDYDDIDRDLDGIGDTYYTKEGVLDKYPLGYFLHPPYKPSNPDPSDAESGVGLKVTLQIYVDDPDSDKLTVYFYRADTDDIIDIDKRVLVDSTASCTFTLPFDTTFAWYAIANDSKLENRSDTWFFTTKATPPDNEPPVARAGGSYTGGINQAIMFNASESYDPDGEIDFYRWNFGDGTSEILAQSPEHIYQNPGSYDVTLTVIDNNGTSAMEKTTVAIGLTNQKPRANAGGSYSCKVDNLVILDGSDSYDSDGTITNYTWEFEDDSTEHGSPATHSFSNAGTYTVVLTVTDDEGATDTTTGIITVTAKSSSTEETPGFELTLAVLAMAFILFRKRRRE